jgi:predicted MPP superfamily phosphohydrolase
MMTRREALRALAAAGIGAAGGMAAYGYGYERHHIGLVRADLPVSGLQQAFEGLRIGLITDLHHSEFVPQEDVANAAALVMAEGPDLIVLGGDYITDRDTRFLAPCVEALAGLSAPRGVYAVLGNHDDDRETPAALRAGGFIVLQDACTTLEVKGGSLGIAGVTFWNRRASEIAQVLRGSPTSTLLLLAHDPRRLAEAADLAVGAVLSGHTHGGQIVLPGLGPIGARRFPVVAGLASRENTSIFVSRGIGTVMVPIRINCPPEVAVLTLRARRAA